MLTPRLFEQLPWPALLHLAPRHGPVAGGTQVVVGVAWEAPAAQPAGEGWHLCRFGEVAVPATRHPSGGSFAPLEPSHGHDAVAVS